MLKNICINYFMYCKKSISLRNIVTTTNNPNAKGNCGCGESFNV